MLTRNFLLAALFSVSVLAHPHGPLNPGGPGAARYTLATRDGDDTDTDDVGQHTGGNTAVPVPIVNGDDTDTDNDGHDTDDDVAGLGTGVVRNDGHDTDTDHDGHDTDTDNDGHDTDTDDDVTTTTAPAAAVTTGPTVGASAAIDGEDTDTDHDGIDTDGDTDDEGATTTTATTTTTRPTTTPELVNAGYKESGFGAVAMGVAGILGVVAVF
ncbi:hypothetical protein QBC40DRAFT_297080 [Triangularia verruculosa]|uniref:Uncharacterized protein n=1 Tax=Triangularia verruculosa TaxID=2587418 RepID=A0AAN6XGU2_9PEZI|nr:hypothetical protein QBC40DRAFT_297080 [Triangularia verruculosa]